MFTLTWYVLVGILLIGYAVLDGFDLGAGILHLFAKGDTNRRLVMNSIGPVWDGNEVWLITAGGALFAAFPHVYATGFSSFYLPFMLLMMALIFRAVSMEFRSKEKSPTWRNFWDRVFALGSTLIAFLFGVAIGNVVMGIPIGEDKEFAGTVLDLLNPYALLTGLFTVILFALHGGMYLIMKTEGELQIKVKKWTRTAFYIFLAFYISLTGFTLWLKPEMMANFSFGTIQIIGSSHSFIDNNQTLISVFVWFMVLLNVLAIANLPRTINKGLELQGFLTSACNIAALITLFALGIFPNMVISSVSPELSLDIYNAASSDYTLKTMFYLALIGMPFVIAYTSIIYWTYRGKVKLDENSY
ncbi:MAG: cytochrome d ubiquinol oxidase subunit II [Bacteroidia bacterium]